MQVPLNRLNESVFNSLGNLRVSYRMPLVETEQAQSNQVLNLLR